MLSKPEEAEGGTKQTNGGWLRGRAEGVISRRRHLEAGRSVRESGGIAVLGVDIAV